MSLLLARRLVEAGVPFVSVFWMEDPKLDDLCKSGGGWDTHGNNFNCLKDHLLPEFDRAFSALLDDLHRRGPARRDARAGQQRDGPQAEGRRSAARAASQVRAATTGRTACRVLFAGGGIEGGQTYGTSDRVAAYPAEHPVTPEDVARTVYHAMGIDDLDGPRPRRPPLRPDARRRSNSGAVLSGSPPAQTASLIFPDRWRRVGGTSLFYKNIFISY